MGMANLFSTNVESLSDSVIYSSKSKDMIDQGGRRSIEVAFTLPIQLAQVQFLALPRFFRKVISWYYMKS